ncbi:MAG: hypothetical protein EOO73_31390 [Myxococcales bacterium]|nr:MAG: hypothetical protein EOO73_31390 [Myxococcales bacterium]
MHFALRSAAVVLRQLALLFATLGATFAACTRVELTEPPPPPPPEEGGAAGQSAGGAGSVQAGRGAGGDEGPSPSGGDPGSLELGLWPTFVDDPSRSRDVQAVTASVAALSAGSAALPLFERWDALSGASGAPLSVTWNRLDAMVEPYRARSGRLSLCIGVVDRAEPAWPVAGGLDSEAARSAMERTVDEALSRYGGVLSHLCFGYELDRYWVSATTAERQELQEFLKQSVEYASAHPLRSTRTAIGVSLSLGAFSAESDVPLAELNVADELLAVYDPVGSGAKLKEPAAIGEELSAALEAVAGLPGPRAQLGLLEVGYPSSQDAGSNEDAQLAYYEALFAALDERRDALSFLGLFGLGDRAAPECEAEAARFGGGAAVRNIRAAARCSMGLRAGLGASVDKPAWEPVLARIARYR